MLHANTCPSCTDKLGRGTKHVHSFRYKYQPCMRKKIFLLNTNMKDRFEEIKAQNVRMKDTHKSKLGDNKQKKK